MLARATLVLSSEAILVRPCTIELIITRQRNHHVALHMRYTPGMVACVCDTVTPRYTLMTDKPLCESQGGKSQPCRDALICKTNKESTRTRRCIERSPGDRARKSATRITITNLLGEKSRDTVCCVKFRQFLRYPRLLLRALHIQPRVNWSLALRRKGVELITLHRGAATNLACLPARAALIRQDDTFCSRAPSTVCITRAVVTATDLYYLPTAVR